MTAKAHREFINQFWESRTHVSDGLIATHFKADNTHDRDFELVSNLVTSDSVVCDLGAGTCIIAARLAPLVRRVVAIDKFAGFLESAPKIDNLTVCAADISDYKSEVTFDQILLFGVITYFDEEESYAIYRRCLDMLKPNGKLIVKHQCGIAEDVNIDRFSEQVGGRYVAFYRHREKEIQILENIFSHVEVIDIYPAENNPWPDTHFYAFVCSKSG